MPTVAQEGEYSFIIHTRELPFEPPHVHVRFGGEEVRIEIGAGTFMEEPPAGKRRAIRQAFERHSDDIRKTWEEIHGPIEEEGDET